MHASRLWNSRQNLSCFGKLHLNVFVVLCYFLTFLYDWTAKKLKESLITNKDNKFVTKLNKIFNGDEAELKELVKLVTGKTRKESNLADVLQIGVLN